MQLTKLYNELFNFKGFRDEDIKKGNVIDVIDNITINGRDMIVKNYDTFIKAIDGLELDDKQRKKMGVVLKTAGVKDYSNITNSVIELKGFLIEVLDGLVDVKAIALDELPDIIDIEVMSARELGIISTITIFSGLVFALEDLALYLLYVAGDEKFIYTIKNREFVKDISMIKGNYKKLRGNIKEEVASLRKLDNELEVKDEASFDLHADGFNKNFDMTSSFLGSPIYILRKAWIDFRIDRIEAMKVKRSLFELKISNLKNKNQGNESLELQESIEYYEGRVAEYEREIKAFEEDI